MPEIRWNADPSVRWTDRIFSQSPDWSGNVFDFFTIVSRKLLRMLKVPFKLKDMVRVDETPMHNAVREALVNCLVNADYYLSRGVLIDSYDDKIVMKNPGLSIVGKRQMLRGGDSEPRNANIMKMFNLLGFGEHAGSGVPDIYAIITPCPLSNSREIIGTCLVGFLYTALLLLLIATIFKCSFFFFPSSFANFYYKSIDIRSFMCYNKCIISTAIYVIDSNNVADGGRFV